MHHTNGLLQKVRRAEQHLTALEKIHSAVNRMGTDWEIPKIQSQADALPQSQGGGEVFQMFGQSSGGAHTVDLRQFVRHTPIPSEMATTFGDLLFNLRSALDHAIWELHAPADRKANVEFPVCLDRKEWAAVSARKIGMLSTEEKTTIEAMQPFNAAVPSEDPLWQLHELNRIDKHRVLHLADHQLKGGWLNKGQSFADAGGRPIYAIASYCVAIQDTGLSVDGEPLLTTANRVVTHVRDNVVPRLLTLLSPPQ